MQSKWPYDSSWFRRSLALLICAVSCSCSGGGGRSGEREDGLQSASQAITSSNASVLGFESVSGWNTAVPKVLDSQRVEGQSSLAVRAQGYTEVQSIALTSLPRIPDKLYVDIALPTLQTNPYWLGAVQLYVELPSRGIYNYYLGQHELTGKPLGKFITLEFTVPSTVKAALAGSYNDLKLKLAINVPYGNGPYLLDNLRLDPGGSGATQDCHPYIEVGKNGDVQYQLLTATRRDRVDLWLSKNGSAAILHSFTAPSVALANGTFLYSFVHPAANYQADDELLVRYSSLQGATTIAEPGPGASDWFVAYRYGSASLCLPKPDRDLDGFPDVVDACPDDREKHESAGQCGCGNSEVDADDDAAADCVDACPADRNRTTRGDCGCVGSFAAVNTPCADGPTSGVHTCDGAGNCGPVPRPNGTSGPVSTFAHDGAVYIVVSANMTWTQAVASAPEGYRIALITSSEQGHIVAQKIVQNLGTNAVAWVDGRTGEPGVVHITNVDGSVGAVFWDGNTTDKVVDHNYSNWKGGQPSSTTGCVSLDARGAQQLESCATPHPVVYVKIADPKPVLIPTREIGAADFPGLVFHGDRPYVPEPCVGQAPGQSPEELASCQKCLDDCVAACAEDEACQAACEGTPGTCSAECASVFPPPAPGSSCSGEFSTQCEVVAKDGHEPTTPCTSNGDCAADPAGTTCGPYNLCPGNDSGCYQRDANDVCITPCSSAFRCGTLPERCAAPFAEPGEACGDSVVLCPDSNAVGDPDPGLVGLSPLLEPQVFDKAKVFGLPSLPVSSQYPDDDPQLPPGSPPRKPEEHPWCHYKVAKPAPDKNVSDAKAGRAGTGKALQFDIDPNVTLDYGIEPLPAGQIDYRVDAQASLSATASFKLASFLHGSFKVLDAVLSARASRCGYSTMDSKLELFDHNFLPSLPYASNFLLDSAEGTTLQESREKRAQKLACEAALAAHQEVADRAKKAMRDAQELLRQYHAWLENPQGSCFDTAHVCSELMSSAPSDFPKISNCATAKIEEVINTFILYYEAQLDPDAAIAGLPGVALPTLDFPSGGTRFSDWRLPNVNLKAPDVSAAGLSLDALNPLLHLKELGSLPSLKDTGDALTSKGGYPVADTPHLDGSCSKSEYKDIVPPTQFQLGPIPMVLNVQGVLSYGLGGHFDFSVNSRGLANLAAGKLSSGGSAQGNADCTNAGMKCEVARVTAKATPCLNAAVAMYVGAGWSRGPLSATAGVGGRVILGQLSMPATATAKVSIAAEDVKVGGSSDVAAAARASNAAEANDARSKIREVASELRGLWSGVSFGERRYKVYLGYDVSLKLTLEKILAGYLEASVKVRFWRFKRQWRKKLLDFGKGIGPLDEVTLLDAHDDFGVASAEWGTIQMPDPFVKFNYLKRLPAQLGDITVGELIAGAGPSLASLTLPKLADAGLDLGRITIPRVELGSLGTALGIPDIKTALLAAIPGIDLNNVSLADLARVNLPGGGALDLGAFGRVPLTVAQLRALSLNVGQIADLGLDLPVVSSKLPGLLDASGLSFGDLGRLGLSPEQLGIRLNQVEIDWRDLPELGIYLSRPHLAIDLQDSGADLTELRLVDFEKLGFNVADFKAWPLTPAQLGSLGLSLSELGSLGFNLADLRLDVDAFLDSLPEGNVPGLTLADLKSRLQLSLAQLGAIRLNAAQLAEVSSLIGFPDIQLELANAGVNLDQVKLADLQRIGIQAASLDKLGISTAALGSMGLNPSELLKLGGDFSSVTSSLPQPSCSRGLDAGRVGEFFYDHQCTCQPKFDPAQFGRNEANDSTIPAALRHKGEQSCFNDADCCSDAPFCQHSDVAGYNVCSDCPSGDCAPDTAAGSCQIDLLTGTTDCNGPVFLSDYSHPDSVPARPTALMRLDWRPGWHDAPSAKPAVQIDLDTNSRAEYAFEIATMGSSSFASDTSQIYAYNGALDILGDAFSGPHHLRHEECAGAQYESIQIGLHRSIDQGGVFITGCWSVFDVVQHQGGGTAVPWYQPNLFALPDPAETDPSKIGRDATLYIGLNRQVRDASHRGQGVTRATFTWQASAP